MRRLVIVSNRLPQRQRVDGDEARKVPAGGLATVLRSALKSWPGSLWMGWDGSTGSSHALELVTEEKLDGISIVGVPLTPHEVSAYYRNMCNEVLWPLFHGFLGRVKPERRNAECYRQVNARFARILAPRLTSGDVVWIHDYHLLCAGQELRKAGWDGPIGFYLHIPFPAAEFWEVLPDPVGLLQAMQSYDVVGFQTNLSADNYRACCARLLGSRTEERRLSKGGQAQLVGTYPVGIEPEDFTGSALRAAPIVARGDLARIVRGRRLILGVDRLDYTKGIPERILAFERLIGEHPEWRKKVSFIQIASPTRERVAGYTELKQSVDHLVGRVNGDLAHHDWVPIRYLYRTYPQHALARFYRDADVGLVTPLRDGMNLIAKEFVAAQNPQTPGVLVLSRFAGAAEELREAVIVNPFIPSDTADGIARALAMPLDERRQRHEALMRRVSRGTATAWSQRYLEDLVEAARKRKTA